MSIDYPICTWTPNTDYETEYWDTGCGKESFVLEGGLKENGMNYCPYCGKLIQEVVMQVADDKETD